MICSSFCPVLKFQVNTKREYKAALRMLLADLEVTEPFIQKTLTDFCNSQLISLSKGRIPVKDTFYLKGCADPTGVLKPDEVVILMQVSALRFFCLWICSVLF